MGLWICGLCGATRLTTKHAGPPQALLHELDKVQGEARSAAARAEAVDAELHTREQLLAAAQVRGTGLLGVRRALLHAPAPRRAIRKSGISVARCTRKHARASAPLPVLQHDVQAKQQEVARLAAERDAEAERAQKEASKARRLEEQLQVSACPCCPGLAFLCWCRCPCC